MSQSIFGEPLNPGEAASQLSRTKQFIRTLPQGAQALFPMAVCYTVEELKQLLAKVETSLTNDGIPYEEIGISLILGKHDNSTSPHTRNKLSVMLVATRFVEDKTTGRVVEIENPVFGTHNSTMDDPLSWTIEEIAFDTGSLWP